MSRTTHHLPRFHRVNPDPFRCQLTGRDVEIITEVRRHRLLRSSEISHLVGGSHQQVLRRLQLLFHHGYLDRPRAQLNSLLTGGSQAIVYALGNKGRRLLESDGNVLPRLGNFRLGHPYIEHTTEISEFMVSLEKAATAFPGIELTNETELGRRSHARDPFRWTVQLQNRRIGVRPDKVFALEHAKSDSRVLCFLEVDRGTMPVKRPGLGRSSFHRKLLAYEATWRQGIHKSRFGFDRMRVLTVTHSEERMRNLVSAARELKSGHGLFLFTTREALKSTSPFDSVWQSVDGSLSQSILFS